MKTADYIFYAAKDAGTDRALWCRYLRKCFVDGEPDISRAEIDYAIENLPAVQAQIVQEIMDPGSDLYEYVRKLNMPAEMKMVNEVIRRIEQKRRSE